MNAHHKAVRSMPVMLGMAMLIALTGCGQPQVIRETVVVVATATAIATVTTQPAAATQPSAPASSTPDMPTAVPVATATVTPQSVAPVAEPTLAPTEAPAATNPPPTTVPTAVPTQVPPTSAPPTSEPTAVPTALPIAWGDLPVLLGSPFLPAGGNMVVINFSPVVFSGATLPTTVRFRILDAAGKVVYESQDDDAPWCPLGDSPTGCSALTLGNAQWQGGVPVLAGRHTLQMTAIDALQRESNNQTQFDLNYAWGELPALGTIGIAPQGAGGLMVSLRVSPANFAGPRPARVIFTVIDPNGNVVFERVDGDSPWCAFGDADTVSNCKALLFDKPAWPSGRPMMTGKHILRIRAEDAQGGTQTEQVIFNIEMLAIEPSEPEQPTLPKLTAVVPPQKNAPLEEAVQYKRLKLKGDLDMQLIYPDKAQGSLMIYLTAKRPGAKANGDGVGRIEFVILDASGRVVNREEESTPAFCAFGGNDPCNQIALKQGAVWPSTGIPISTGPYTVQVSVWGKDKSGKLTGPWRGRAKFDVIVPGQN